MSLLVTGTVGLDTVETPLGKAESALGGSAVYFSFGAAPYTRVRLVAVVGADFPAEFRALLEAHNVDLRGLETHAGHSTFRWSGKYTPDMNDRDTLDLQLNVVEEVTPQVPAAFADSEVVFLANTHPGLQQELLSAVRSPRLTVCDTMDHWIDSARDELLATLGKVDGLIINDAEARQLTGRTNLIEAAEEVLKLGPGFVVVKKGEHGALLATGDSLTAIPAYPTRNVKDPTGAGDSFAGGMLGYLATQSALDDATLRRSLLHGTVAASFTIEDFSLGRVQNLTRDEIDRRVAKFQQMLRIE